MREGKKEKLNKILHSPATFYTETGRSISSVKYRDFKLSHK